MAAAIVLGQPPTASAQAPANDNFANAVPLVIGQTDSRYGNVGATNESGEALTPASTERPFCSYAGGRTSQANFTVWWSVVGTGRRMRVETTGSNFDTHLGIFGSSVNDPSSFCFDGAPNEFLEFDSTAGQTYHVQVGDCRATATPIKPCTANGNSSVSVLATSPAAANDQRSAAAAMPTGQLVTGDNFAATEEGGEQVDCASERGASPYGRTVWYRWTAPNPGTAVFTASGFDTVLAVYSGNGTTALRCDDDPAVAGPSRIQIPVSRGDYLLQVGGYGRHAGFADSNQGRFNVLAEFAENPDRDGDGTANVRDCQPDNPAVHLGATDIPRNGVDEDCVRGDAPYPRLASVPVLQSTRYFSYWRIRRITVRRVAARTRIEVRCRGGGCPLRRQARSVRRAAGAVTFTPRKLRRARIRQGAVLEIRVSRPRTIGVVRRYSFSRLRRPPRAQDRCLLPGDRSPNRRC